MAPIDPKSQPPPEIPGHDVIRLIGRGGMGRVYLARQRRLGRSVCVKLLDADAGSDRAASRARFEREARLLAAASHPHVLTVLDFGVLDDGSPYLVTEYVERGDLRKLMAAGPVAPARRRSILAQIGQALLHIHSLGILHRDLKPENILTPTDSLAKVADFGLAVLETDRDRLTRSSRGMGTLVYAPPEQLAGAAVDARSDQYSLAAIAYEMLTGRRPAGSFKPPSALNSTLDERIDAVVMKALSPNPADRHSELKTFLDALDRALAPPPSTLALRTLAVLGLALVVATAILAARSLRSDPQPVPAAPPRASRIADAPSSEPSEAFRRLTALRAHEIWVSQGRPTGEAGDAVSLSNWLAAEERVREQTRLRAYEIWVSQGSPTGPAGVAVRDANMSRAETELLREAEQASPLPQPPTTQAAPSPSSPSRPANQ